MTFFFIHHDHFDNHNFPVHLQRLDFQRRLNLKLIFTIMTFIFILHAHFDTNILSD